MTGSLFDLIEHPRASKYVDWRPESPPVLDGVRNVYLDFETDGLKWWDGHRPIGVAYLTDDGRTGYLPTAHRGDPANLDESVVKRWMHEQLRGKHVTNINTAFDIHMSQEWGVDLEEIGCTVADVAHWAALLDDRRKRFSLEVLCQDYLPDERKVLTIDGEKLDGSRMAHYPAGMIAVRAMADVRQVKLLKDAMWPLLDLEELHRVRALEDGCIYASCEMERNGLPIDVELLTKWRAQARERYNGYLMQISHGVGLNFSPKSATSWRELFRRRSIEVGEWTADGRMSTQYDVLRRVPDEYVQIGCKAMKLADLLSDYLDKYANTVGSDGILRFRLNQLRSDEGGTITGRFSASAFKINGETIGANPQQVPDTVKSVEKGHDPEFQIRRLFLTDIAADASQIEYRIFSSYAKNPRVLAAYREDPNMSFHRLIHSMVLPYKPDLSYGHCKNMNFGKLYSAGLVKLAVMMGHLTQRQADDLRAQFIPKSPPRTHPLLARAAEVDNIYARELPEVSAITRRMSNAAMERGYVKTIMGRRIRFENRQRLHKALNGVIQGSAADVMKLKTTEVHRERRRIGFLPRCTVHDELVGSKQDPETKRLLLEVLNRQSIPEFVVPILWEAKEGANWAEC